MRCSRRWRARPRRRASARSRAPPDSAASSPSRSPCHQHVPPSASIELRAQPRVVVRPRCRRHRLQPSARLGEVAVLLPEAPHREGDADRDRRVGRRDRPIEDRPDVVVLELEPVEPAPLVGARTARRPPAARAPRTSRDGGRGSRSVSPSASSRSAAYSRIVSRSRKRGSPSAVSSTLTRLWSTSAISPSRMSPPISDDGPQTASADARSQPPAKTDSRSSSRFPPSSSRS